MDLIAITISAILAKSQPLLVILALSTSPVAVQLAALGAIALTLVGLLGLAIYNIKKYNKKSAIGSPVDNVPPPPPSYDNQSNFVNKIPSQAPPIYNEEPEPAPIGPIKKEPPPPAFEDINAELPPGYVEPIKKVLTTEVLSDIICSKFTLDQHNPLESFFNTKEVPESVDAIFDPYGPSREKLRLEVRHIFLTILSHKAPSHELTKNEFESFITMSRDLLSSIGEKHSSLSYIKWAATNLLQEEIENSPYIEFANSVSPSP